MNAVETHSLTKRYGAHPALQQLDMCVPAGALFGFLGPNGAGKTTTIRLLLGLLRATDGRAVVLGHDPWSDGPALRRAVGYLPGDVRLYDGLTGRDTLRFFDAARKADAWHEVERLRERFDLNLDRRVREYSRGMKQKLGLIIAMMHKPRLLILDEPTTALDPLIREVLYAELRAVVQAGRTVLFSSHTLAEVEALCDEVAILRAGKLVEQERVAVLRQRAVRHVEVRFTEGTVPPPPDGFEGLQQSHRQLRAAWTGPVDGLVAWLARCPVHDVTIAPPDLEDLFLAYYKDTPAGDPHE
jgi:ABC-2 type transport system ATP-binding protein